MHELGILSAMVKTIETVAKQEQLQRIEKIVLQVGELSGVVPSYLESCYPAAVYKTFMKTPPWSWRSCRALPAATTAARSSTPWPVTCSAPECASQNLTALSGRELVIKEIQGC